LRIGQAACQWAGILAQNRLKRLEKSQEHNQYMSIKVRYFASLADRLGREGDELDATGILTAADVWKSVSSEALPANTLVAINMEYAKPGAAVADGDEVAFFPPVTGG
jgi:molybdopterin synthase sulfur carrier subunit